MKTGTTPNTCSRPCAARAATSSRRARRRPSCTSRSARHATRSTPASRSSMDTGGRVERFQRGSSKGAEDPRLSPPEVELSDEHGDRRPGRPEGVMMRSPSSWAVAVRSRTAQSPGRPGDRLADGSSAASGGSRSSAADRAGESLAIGFRALAISANYAAEDPEKQAAAAPSPNQPEEGDFHLAGGTLDDGRARPRP